MTRIPLHPDITFLGETNFRNARKRFGIKRDDRRRHTYLIGKTGMGKSTMIENLVIQDIYNGNGLALVDPHGDLVEKVIKLVPEHRIKDVIYFNPADLEHPIAFNVVEKVDPEYRHLVASGLVGVFKKIWADSWGPRLEYLLRNVILALLDSPESTLLGIPRMFVDNNFRKRVITQIQDPVVKAFWVDEFAKYNQQFLTEAISPIQNKVGQFLSSSLIRNIVGQKHSSINLREAMDNKKIILLNLSKGRIGEDNAALLGAMMITKIQLAAMSRVDIVDEEHREDFYLYVDEFQNFATDSFANILSEARKYRLNLIMAHQYIEQLSDLVRAAVFGNVGTMVAFRVGATDADELVKEFTPQYAEEDLVNIPKYNCYLKLMIDGVSSEPFSARSLPPFEGNTGVAQKVIEYTRQTYASPKEEVEWEIREWSGMLTPEEASEQDEEKKRKKRNKKKIKKIEGLLPEYEKLAKMGNKDAESIVTRLNQAMKDLERNQDVDIGDIIGRDEDEEEKDVTDSQTSETHKRGDMTDQPASAPDGASAGRQTSETNRHSESQSSKTHRQDRIDGQASKTKRQEKGGRTSAQKQDTKKSSSGERKSESKQGDKREKQQSAPEQKQARKVQDQKQPDRQAQTSNEEKPGKKDQSTGDGQGEQRQQQKKKRKKTEITCDRCGKKDTVPFDPDPNKPIYCADCLKIIKEERKQGDNPPSGKGEAELTSDADDGSISLKKAQEKMVSLQHGSPKDEDAQSLQPGQKIEF